MAKTNKTLKVFLVSVERHLNETSLFPDFFGIVQVLTPWLIYLWLREIHKVFEYFSILFYNTKP